MVLQFLFVFAQAHDEFRIPELSSVSELHGFEITILPPADVSRPFMILELESESHARLLARRCILVKFRGGDILEDYPSEMILETMEALGVGPDNDPDEVAPFTDPLWETPLGKEIFEDYMKVGLPSSTAQYSDEGVIEDEAFYDSWPVEDDGTTDN